VTGATAVVRADGWARGDERPLPPADAAVPQLPGLLDRDMMTSVLQRSLAARASIAELRVASIDYRPGHGCTVAYDVQVAGSRRCAVAATCRTGSVEPAIRWYPQDPAMPVLAEPVGELLRRMSRAGIEVEASAGCAPTLLLYRPGRRAVLRLGDVVLKAYDDQTAFRAGANGLRIAERLFGRPRLRGALTDVRLTVQSAIDGVPVRRARAADVAPVAGVMLRCLHEARLAGLQPALPDRLLGAAASAGELVAGVAPELAGRARRIVQRLEERMPHGLSIGPSHGDFNISQLVDVDGAPALLDFDESCLAPRALDVSAYAANLVSGRPGDPDAAQRALDALLAGYGTRPEGLDWYLAATLTRRAPSPFKQYKRRWPERMASILDAAEAVLGA
jgi:hypothetical protein